MTYNERLQHVAEQMAANKYGTVLWEHWRKCHKTRWDTVLKDMLPLARIALELAAGEVEAYERNNQILEHGMSVGVKQIVEGYLISQGLVPQQPNNG